MPGSSSVEVPEIGFHVSVQMLSSECILSVLWSLLSPGLLPPSAFGCVGFSWRGGEEEVLPFRCLRH